MLLRFRWFSVTFVAFFVSFVYSNACDILAHHWATVHPMLVAISIASAFVGVGGMFAALSAWHENLGFAGLLSYFLGAFGSLLLIDPPRDYRQVVVYVFPSIGDYVLMGAVAFNLILALLMVFARVPKGKLLIVNGCAYYGGEQPVFLPWMKYNVEKFDEISVKVEFRCAAGTSVACEAALAPNVEWCRTNGVVNVNVAHFKEAAAQIVKRNICNRAEIRDVSWVSAGETLDALASLNPATLQDTAAGVSFRCLRFTVTAATMKTAA